MNERMLDDIDKQILTIIQKNGRTSNADIARGLKMAPSGILERIRKLEERGVIQRYEARLNPRALGLGLAAFVYVRTNERPGHDVTAKRLSQIPEVLEVHHIAGEDCFLVKVRVRDPESLGRLLRSRFGGIKSIVSTRTTIVLETVKETGILPVDGPSTLRRGGRRG